MGKRLTSIARQFQQELRVYRLVLKDKRTPWLAKVLLGAAIAYTLMPIDIIPDFIPILGHLDDLVIVPALVVVGLKLIPKEVVDDARNAVKLTRKGFHHGNSDDLRHSLNKTNRNYVLSDEVFVLVSPSRGQKKGGDKGRIEDLF